MGSNIGWTYKSNFHLSQKKIFLKHPKIKKNEKIQSTVKKGKIMKRISSIVHEASSKLKLSCYDTNKKKRSADEESKK